MIQLLHLFIERLLFNGKLSLLSNVFDPLSDMGPTGIDSKCICCICMSGGGCTPVNNSFELYLAIILMPWLPNFEV